jgi:hypothetical protein
LNPGFTVGLELELGYLATCPDPIQPEREKNWKRRWKELEENGERNWRRRRI